MLAKDYFPDSYEDVVIDEERVPIKMIRQAITFVEKSEPGITVYVGNVIVFKNKNKDIIVTDSCKILPSEKYKRMQEEGEELIKEVEEFLNE